jgi:DNA-binding NarL/FixJ family response regulator
MSENMDQNTNETKKVFVVDDHPLIRDAIAMMLRSEDDLEFCGEAGTVADALSALKEIKPDIIVVDLILPDLSGFELIRHVKSSYPELPVLVFSMHNEANHAARAIRAGAKGYVMKKESGEVLIKAIHHVLSGRIWISKKIIPNVIDSCLGKESDQQGVESILSKRELQIFEMIGKGISTDQIGKELYISRRTVESHRDHIKNKLNIPDVLKLHQLAFRWTHNELTI